MVAATTSNSALSTQSSALSPLDQALLTRFYEDGISTLHDLFQSLARNSIENAPPTLFALTQWAHSEPIKPWVDIRAAQHREALQREMIALLKDLAKTSDNQVERRRAATTILRSLNPPGGVPRASATRHPRALSSDPGLRTQDSGPSSPPRGTPHLSPSPTLDSDDIAHAIAEAILKPDDPDDLATIEAFTAPQATIDSKPVVNLPAQVRALKRRGEFLQLIGPYQRDDQLHDPTANTRRYQAVYSKEPSLQSFTFVRSPHSSAPNSWLLAAISQDTS